MFEIKQNNTMSDYNDKSNKKLDDLKQNDKTR